MRRTPHPATRYGRDSRSPREAATQSGEAQRRKPPELPAGSGTKNVLTLANGKNAAEELPPRAPGKSRNECSTSGLVSRSGRRYREPSRDARTIALGSVSPPVPSQR